MRNLDELFNQICKTTLPDVGFELLKDDIAIFWKNEAIRNALLFSIRVHKLFSGVQDDAERKVEAEAKLKASICSTESLGKPVMHILIYIGRRANDYRLFISVLTFNDQVKAVLQIGLNSGSPTRNDYETTAKGMDLVLQLHPHFRLRTPPATVKSNTRTNHALEEALEKQMQNMTLRQ